MLGRLCNVRRGPVINDNNVLPGDTFILGEGQYDMPQLYTRNEASRPGESRFNNMTFALVGARGLVICTDDMMNCWHLVLVDDRLGWVSTSDVDSVERAGVVVQT